MLRFALVALVAGFVARPAAAVADDGPGSAASPPTIEQRLSDLEARVPPAPPTAPAHEQPLDEKEPTFGEFDFAWMNGNNPQPASLLKNGPVTFSLYVDTLYVWLFIDPIDQTFFQTSYAPI